MSAGVPAGGWTIVRGGDGWPQALEELRCPPQELHGLGDPSALLGPCLSIIGARRSTPYGEAVAAMAGRVAAQCGIVVVSGGAMGCDRAAGKAAIDAGGKTVVVAGCGADVVYPESSREVFERAAGGEGCVVSMEPWGQGARQFTFPKRNAIIAALSQSLLVTEAGRRSGTMSTASTAVELDRTIYAIPGSIFSPGSQGTNHLIAEGAHVIADERDLEMAIALDYGTMRFSQSQEPARREMGRVMSALVASPMRPDEIATTMGEDVITVLKSLADYEAAGIVTRLPDGRYSPSEGWYLGQKRWAAQGGAS